MLPILLALAFIAIIFIVVTAGQPDEFTISRSANISAPPGKIFPHVNDLHQWEAWSPWAKIDPNAKNSFEGADSGVGAAMSWSGSKKLGEGRMTITGSEANEFIGLKLEFVKPLKATHSADFAFKSGGNQTVVTWRMSGKKNFFFKVFGLFMDCEKMGGRDFEKGLAAMKSVVEADGNN
jgi:Polyketide cyclase / dehydrase and lipid transport